MIKKFEDISCQCDRHNELRFDEMVVEEGALARLPAYLKGRNIREVTLVVDQRTYEVAGRRLNVLLLENGLNSSVCLLEDDEQGDVIADGDTILQLFTTLGASVDIILAVGAGTIHDIVRFVCDKLDKPFISVPTAASVDGFTSAGAPLVIRGVKKTFQASSPIALFADIDIIKAAPQAMTAAGFADMMAKTTSLVDWKISHLLADEPYCEKVAAITEEALLNCIKHRNDIALGNSYGMKVLMNGLIDSGMAMLLADHSRSASGAEHHLSHYWEMEFLRLGRRQLLHGTKVGVTTILIADLYRNQLRSLIEDLVNEGAVECLRIHGADITAAIDGILPADKLKELLNDVNGPTIPEDIGIATELVERSLREAIHLRDRYTGLKMLHEFK